MRIAVLPIIMFPNVLGESDFLVYRGYIEDMLKIRDDLYFYFFVPSEGMKLVKPHPRIHWIDQGPIGVFYDQQGSVPATFLELFNPRRCRYPIDLAWTSRTGAVPGMYRELFEYRLGDVVPILLNDPKVAGYKDTHQSVSDKLLMAHALGYAMAECMFPTERELQLAVQVVRRYLAPSMIRVIVEKARIIPLGFGAKEIDKIASGVNKNPKFSAFFAGRVNVNKRVDKILELYTKLFAGGRDIDIVVSSPKADGLAFDDIATKYGMGHIEYWPSMAFKDFIRLAAGCHVYVNMSKVEGFTVGLIEQMYLGLVCLLPKATWVKALIGDEAYESYPFLYSGEKEAAQLLRYVYENYDEAKSRVAHIPQYLRDRYDRAKIAEQLLTFMNQLVVDPGAALLSPTSMQHLRFCLEKMGDEFSLDELFALYVDKADVIKNETDVRRGQPNKWVVYKYLCRSKKYVDLHDGPVPIFRKIA